MARELYEMQEWEDLPSENTPLSAGRLEHIEQGIRNNSENAALKEIYGDNGLDLSPIITEGFGGNVGLLSMQHGYNSNASGVGSYAGGNGAIASGDYSFSNGNQTKSLGENSYAEGNYSEANAKNSHAEGNGTKASSPEQHVQGRFNIEDTQGIYAHIIGGGMSGDERKNICTLDWQGNAIFAGDVQGTFNNRTITLYGLQMEIEGRCSALQQQMQSGFNTFSQQIESLASRIAALEENQNATERGEAT